MIESFVHLGRFPAAQPPAPLRRPLVADHYLIGSIWPRLGSWIKLVFCMIEIDFFNESGAFVRIAQPQGIAAVLQTQAVSKGNLRNSA
jgi:hypothetical protein